MEAEQLRVALFKRVFAARQPVHPGEIELLPLQLAYFRRYQLDVQLRYFEGRGKELFRLAGCSVAFTSLIVFAVAMAALVAIAMFLHVAHEHGWLRPGAHILAVNVEQIEGVAWWAFLALALSSLYAVLVAQQDVTEDERNGARYPTHHANLSFLRTAGYEHVRRAAEAGDRSTVERYVQLVHEVLIAEQAQWISFTSMVETGDRMLAESSAVGLAELFADRFGERAGNVADTDRRPRAAVSVV